jgi:hypothetical protein
MRWDETWNRLREWPNGQGQSERLAGQVLLADGYSELDPSHPLGGKDDGKDALCCRDGKRFAVAVYFPRGRQRFAVIKKKFRDDLSAARTNNVDGLLFVTNQELRLAERQTLSDSWPKHVEIYHLERITAVLDKPEMYSVRKQFLDIDPDSSATGIASRIWLTAELVSVGPITFDNRGAQIRFAIRVTNNGHMPATNVQVFATLMNDQSPNTVKAQKESASFWDCVPPSQLQGVGRDVFPDKPFTQPFALILGTDELNKQFVGFSSGTMLTHIVGGVTYAANPSKWGATFFSYMLMGVDDHGTTRELRVGPPDIPSDRIRVFDGQNLPAR